MSLAKRLLRNGLRFAAIAAPALAFVVGRVIWSFVPLPEVRGPFFAPLSAQAPPSFDPLALIHLEYALSALVIAIPAGIVVADWIRQLRRGRLAYGIPVLWVFGSIVLAVANIAIGLRMGASDALLIDSYYVVAHYRTTIRICAGFSIFAGFYFWFPAITGTAYSTVLGRLQFWSMFAGMSVITFPLLATLFVAMPRRYSDMPEAFATLRTISLIGPVIVVFSLLVFLAVLIEALVRRRPAVLEASEAA